jgi:hypothetical protein
MDIMTAKQIMDNFFKKYPEYLTASNDSTVRFIETLPTDEKTLYKSALAHFARLGGYGQRGN